jgi:superfamily II DNA or RNA helicase
LREKQSFVLNEIDAAFASGYNHIIVEAPTGFGKSPVGIATALTLGSSYILTSTENLQTQYARDFSFVSTYSKNIITLAVITVALGILTTTQVNAVSSNNTSNNNTSTQKNPAQEHGKVIMWGLARCTHNSNVGLICTGRGGHPQNSTNSTK